MNPSQRGKGRVPPPGAAGVAAIAPVKWVGRVRPGVTDGERLVGGQSGRMLLVASIGWLAIQTGRLSLSPLLPSIQADLGISATQAGVALTVLWGLYALLQYPSGRLSDKLSRKTLLVAGLGLLSLGFLSLGSAPNYPVFLLGAAVTGVGAGLYPTAARALLADLFVARRGRAFGLHTASGDVGGVAAAGLASVVVAVAVWRAAFLPVVAVLLVAAVALHVWSQESYVLERAPLALRATVGRLLGQSRFRRLLVVYVMFAFTWQAAVGFLPTFFQVGKGFPPWVANIGFAVLFGVGAVVKPLAGGLGDEVPRELLTPASLGLAALALGLIVVAGDPLVAVGGVVLFAVGLMSFPPVMQAHLMDAFPNDSAGGDLGALRSAYIGVGSLGTTYVGAVADVAGYATAFTGLVGCLCLAVVLLVALAR